MRRLLFYFVFFWEIVLYSVLLDRNKLLLLSGVGWLKMVCVCQDMVFFFFNGVEVKYGYDCVIDVGVRL